MPKSRREFLGTSSAALAAAAVAPKLDAQEKTAPPARQPPAFGTTPAAGPDVSAATFAQAEKLVQVEFGDQQRAQAAQNWRQSKAAL